MMHISHAGCAVTVDGVTWATEYPVKEAFTLAKAVCVLLEPDAYLSDTGYSKERRRGNGALRNLRAYSPTGDLLWEAEFPEPADYYYRIVSREPLVALSFSSYRCRIDPGSGRIVESEFMK
jgi:hypothetical protein